MNTKLVSIFVLLFFILRDTGCPATSSSESYSIVTASGYGNVVNSIYVPVVNVKVISFFTDTLRCSNRLIDSTRTANDGSYSIKYPEIKVVGGGNACNHYEPGESYLIADFFLVFITPSYDTTVVSFQVAGHPPVNPLSHTIDTTYSYETSMRNFPSMPTIVLKSKN